MTSLYATNAAILKYAMCATESIVHIVQPWFLMTTRENASGANQKSTWTTITRIPSVANGVRRPVESFHVSLVGAVFAEAVLRFDVSSVLTAVVVAALQKTSIVKYASPKRRLPALDVVFAITILSERESVQRLELIDSILVCDWLGG